MWVVFGGLILLDIVSFLTLHTGMETVLFGMALVLTIIIAIKSPRWLFPIAIAEIISTSNGHSLNAEILGISVGLRIAIFGALIVVSCIEIARSRQNYIPNRYMAISILFVTLILYGTILGLLNGNGFRNLYLDANGYLAVGYIFSAWVWVRDPSSRRLLLQAIGAGALWIAVKSLLFLFMFGHLHPKTLDPVYKWIRDTRLGEITLQGGNVYRVFLQSQWFLVPVMLTTAGYIWLAERSRETGVRIVFILAFAGILASLSRSFWVALVVTVPLLVIAGVWWSGWRNVARKIPDFAVIKIGTVALLWVIIAVPIYQTANFSLFSDLFSGRASGVSDVAIDSRQSLLTPMLDAVTKSPATGYGLGTTLAYKTSDPRWIDSHATDIVETYAFEWGWLDIWIKFGILGIFAFLWLACLITQDLWRMSKLDQPRRWLYLSLFLSLLGIYTVHFFSPYLNHPIGLATIAIVVALIPFEDVRLHAVRVREEEKINKRVTAKATARNIL